MFGYHIAGGVKTNTVKVGQTVQNYDSEKPAEHTFCLLVSNKTKIRTPIFLAPESTKPCWITRQNVIIVLVNQRE